MPVGLWLALAVSLTGLAACGSAGPGVSASGRVRVVAAESFWGSIASQVGGDRVTVDSIIANPDTDPHAYEPTASDAIAMAGAQLAIVNGIGYDTWASKLLSADGSGSGRVLNVGSLLGLGTGQNPHQWYSPASVLRVSEEIAADLERLDPRDRAYFARRGRAFLTRGLGEYNRLISEIRRRYGGVPVGYSESIFEPLGHALGLKLMTPKNFAKAIAEGIDISAADRRAVDAQARRHLIAVWVYNRQNATPDVQRVDGLARAAGIPLITITETLSPAAATFEQWQTAELRNLEQALHKSTGR